jgi:hypothetical protein
MLFFAFLLIISFMSFGRIHRLKTDLLGMISDKKNTEKF